MTDITFISADQSWQEESTIYWFEVKNCHYLCYVETIGVVEGRNAGLVWDDGDPIPQGETRDHLERRLEVTDEIRRQAHGLGGES
jgi:hypothetical protein